MQAVKPAITAMVISTVIFIVAMATAIGSSSPIVLNSKIWQQLPKNASVTMTVTTSAMSRSECAAKCTMSSEGRCVTFCTNVNSHECYMAVEVTPAVNILPADTEVHCYRRDVTCDYPAGYSSYEGLCLKVYEEKAKFQQAAARCQAEGGHLLYYKSMFWYAPALRQLLQDFTGTRYYVGATDIASEGTFTWGDGTPVSPDVWNPGEPNNWLDREDCANLYKNKLRLYDSDCENAEQFICELDN